MSNHPIHTTVKLSGAPYARASVLYYMPWGVAEPNMYSLSDKLPHEDTLNSYEAAAHYYHTGQGPTHAVACTVTLTMGGKVTSTYGVASHTHRGLIRAVSAIARQHKGEGCSVMVESRGQRIFAIVPGDDLPPLGLVRVYEDGSPVVGSARQWRGFRQLVGACTRAGVGERLAGMYLAGGEVR